MKALFDTGTTHTLFPEYIHAKVMKQLSVQCMKLGKHGCRGLTHFNQNTCVSIDLKKYKSADEFFSVFPPLTFEFQNGAKMVWMAREYFHLKYDTTPAHYCLTFKPQGNSQALFGNTFMRHYDIFFDRVNSEIHYVKAHCDNATVYSIRPYMNLPGDKKSGKKDVKKRILAQNTEIDGFVKSINVVGIVVAGCAGLSLIGYAFIKAKYRKGMSLA